MIPVGLAALDPPYILFQRRTAQATSPPFAAARRRVPSMSDGPESRPSRSRSHPLRAAVGAGRRGTGKTRVVTYRIAELIRRRTDPDRILAVTFTNKAANEMQQRSAAILGKRMPRKPEISTFHSLCVRILRRHITKLGYPAAFAIYDRGDQEGVARTVLREIKAADGLLRPGDLLWFIGRWKTACVGPRKRPRRPRPRRSTWRRRAIAAIRRPCRPPGPWTSTTCSCASRSCSRDSKRSAPPRPPASITCWSTNTRTPTTASTASSRPWPADIATSASSATTTNRSTAARAEVAHILGFKKDWPDAKVIRLETNYRSTREIVAWANRLIAFNSQRHAKTLRANTSGEPPRVLQLKDETKEAKVLVEEIAAAVSQRRRRPRDFAVLCRTNEQPRAFELELRRAKSLTSSSAACPSTTARKSATSSPISRSSPIRATRSRCCASSTRRRGASENRR